MYYDFMGYKVLPVIWFFEYTNCYMIIYLIFPERVQVMI